MRRVEVVVHRLDETLAGGPRVEGGVRVWVGGGGERLPEAGGGALRARERLVGVVARAAVVRVQHGEANGVRRIALQRLADRHEVAERLAHLLRVHIQQTVVEPESRERALAGERLALGDFVLVVRKNEVLPAAVDVHALAEVAERHRGALDVPAGASRSPGALPRGLPRFRGLPERKVHRMLLADAGLDPRAGAHRVQRPAAQLAVLLVAADAEIDVAAGLVGVPRRDEAGGHLDDLGEFLRGAGVGVGLADVEGGHILEVLGDAPLGERLDGHALLRGALDEFVVYVREVLNAPDAEAAELQVAMEDVEDDVTHRVADVRGGVGRDAADVDANLVAGRRELALLAGERVG